MLVPNCRCMVSNLRVSSCILLECALVYTNMVGDRLIIPTFFHLLCSNVFVSFQASCL